MNVLQNLTPYAHHELGYKPRNARAAGIKIPALSSGLGVESIDGQVQPDALPVVREQAVA
jgi:hypothetical protein